MGPVSKEINGYIKYHELIEWWTNIPEVDKNKILESLPEKDEGISLLSKDSLLRQDIRFDSGTRLGIVTSVILSGFSYPNDQKKIERYSIDRDKIEKYSSNLVQMIKENREILDIHFFYSTLAGASYFLKDRDDNAIMDAIKYCKKCIEVSMDVKKQLELEYPDSVLPHHYCFKQLSIIYEKMNKIQEAIDVVTVAKEQGWSGDNWAKSLEKLYKKIIKNK
jgi:hypothetical protein